MQWINDGVNVIVDDKNILNDSDGDNILHWSCICLIIFIFVST
jgi:hypothetical protein